MQDMRTLVVVSGLPGKMATLVANALGDKGDYSLVNFGLTGSKKSTHVHKFDNEKSVILFQPDDWGIFLRDMVSLRSHTRQPLVVVDFSHPSAVNDNAEFYCQNQLPFVMGTTGGDREKLKKTVEDSDICAVVAPNMAAQVVALQAMIEYGAKNFPGCFSGFDLDIIESHQASKADPSGTAKALIPHFRSMGLEFDEEEIEMIRDESEQLTMGVPREHLGGHGWHTYSITKIDGSMKVEFVHDINGRVPYVDGTMKALDFLVEKVKAGTKGKMFSMIDVLRGQ